MERRLTTIFAADIAGYSRLVADDEENVVARLRAIWRDLVDPTIAGAGGRVVKLMGDGVLAEFASPAGAVDAAIAIQNAMRAQEAERPEAQRLRFRIGVNTGDVIVEGGDILGDAVNIAARLETLAPPGGLCVSRAVHDHIAGRVAAPLTPLGAQPVRNMPEPVETWRVEIAGADLTAAASGAGVKAAARPSIAVLPFDNLSRDPDQDFLADGVVEDVITELSRFRSLFVIARNSTLAYKGAAKDVREIARELGVRYVVEGSERSAGGRVRVTAQLIDAETGAHVWAERWDRVIDDIFALQDELTTAIVTRLEPELGAHERALARRKPTESLTAWEMCQRAYVELYSYEPERITAAADLCRKAADADPGFAEPLALLSRTHWIAITAGRTADPAGDNRQGLDLARKAVALDDRSEAGQAALGVHLAMSGQAASGASVMDKALAQNPNHSLLYFARAVVNMFSEWPDADRMEADARAMLRVSPRDPAIWGAYAVIACAHIFRAGDHWSPDVTKNFIAACDYPNAEWYCFVSAAIGLLAQDDRAGAETYMQRALAKRPDLTIAGHKAVFRFPAWRRLVANEEARIDALGALGVPLR